MAPNQIALITGKQSRYITHHQSDADPRPGGASGMGLAVAQALAERGGWKIHLLEYII